jgi:Ni/Co efflux regulator RcnB
MAVLNSILFARGVVVLSLCVPAFAWASPPTCVVGAVQDAAECSRAAQGKPWAVGSPIPVGLAWYELRDWDRFGLPAPPEGSRYVRIADDILRVAVLTGDILGYLGAVGDPVSN